MPVTYNTTLPKDSAGNPIPVLSVAPLKGQKIASTASSARNGVALGGNTQVVSLYATEDCYIEFGDSTVAANTNTSFFLAKGIYKDFSVNDKNEMKFTHIAVIRATADGTLYLHERM